MIGLLRGRLKREYSVKSSDGCYGGIWFRDSPKNPSTPYKFYLGVRNLQTNSEIIKPVERFSYFKKNIPFFSLQELNFDEEGLVAEVQRIIDITGDRDTHLAQNLRVNNKRIRIPNRFFPN